MQTRFRRGGRPSPLPQVAPNAPNLKKKLADDSANLRIPKKRELILRHPRTRQKSTTHSFSLNVQPFALAGVCVHWPPSSGRAKLVAASEWTQEEEKAHAAEAHASSRAKSIKAFDCQVDVVFPAQPSKCAGARVGMYSHRGPTVVPEQVCRETKYRGVGRRRAHRFRTRNF